MDIIINILAFVFSLGLIVALHELGHFFFAKRAKIYVMNMPSAWDQYYGRKEKAKQFTQLEQFQLVDLFRWQEQLKMLC